MNQKVAELINKKSEIDQEIEKEIINEMKSRYGLEIGNVVKVVDFTIHKKKEHLGVFKGVNPETFNIKIALINKEGNEGTFLIYPPILKVTKIADSINNLQK